MQDQPPEARIRIGNLLRDRIQPTLGGRMPIDGRIHIVSRLAGGGVLLHLPGGVSIPRDDDPSAPPTIVQPAWISIRPGHPITLLEPVLIKDADPAKHRFFAFGDEWLISDTAQGPRRLYGNHLEPMLRKGETMFAHVVGFDPRGRWLFRKSAPDGTDDTSETLLIDPTLPDPTPKLPVWLMTIEKGSVGWNVEDYPAVNRGGRRHSWVLIESGWRPLDESKDRLITEKPPEPKPPEPKPVEPKPPADAAKMMVAATLPATTHPATQPATQRASTQSTQPTTLAATTSPATTSPATTSPATTSPATTQTATTQTALGPRILVDPEGRTYHDGRETITVVDRTGKVIVWPLPSKAAGEADFDVVLLRTKDGTLFLLNASGRVVRVKPTPDGDEPFMIEAVFTHRIPEPEKIHRIWLDPAGRIVMAYDKNKLAVMFPAGRIPPNILTMIPARELRDDAELDAEPAQKK
jgi:outer membrane biosynthesis protein TonB